LGTTAITRGALLLLPVMSCLLFSAPVAGEAQPLALPQIIDYALQNNGDIKSLCAEKGVRDADTMRAAVLPNPILDFEAGTGALTGSNAESSLSIGVAQEFSIAGRRDKRMAVAGHELEAYMWMLADRRRVVAEEVKMAFYDSILAEQRLSLADRSIALNRQLLEVTRERLAAGDIPALEMDLAQVELTRSEGSRIESELMLLRNRARLFNLMGMSVGESPEIIGTLENSITLANDLAGLKHLAKAKRPDLKALEAEKAKGDAEINLAHAEGVPNLTVGLALKRDTTAMEIGSIEGKDTAYTIGLKLSMPIPLFDQNRAGVHEAQARKSSSEIRLTAAATKAERDVETAFLSYRNSEKVLALYKSKIIPQLEENLKLTQEAYRVGEVGILAVIQEQKKFFEVSEAYLAVMLDRQIALVKLESSVGGSLE